MNCASLQLHQAQIPSTLQSLLVEELFVAMEASGQYHLGTMISSKLEGQGRLSIDLVVKAEHVHSICSRLQVAHEPQNLEVLVVGLQEDLGVGCSPVRIWRQGESSKGLEQFCKAEELLILALLDKTCKAQKYTRLRCNDD